MVAARSVAGHEPVTFARRASTSGLDIILVPRPICAIGPAMLDAARARPQPRAFEWPRDASGRRVRRT